MKHIGKYPIFNTEYMIEMRYTDLITWGLRFLILFFATFVGHLIIGAPVSMAFYDGYYTPVVFFSSMLLAVPFLVAPFLGKYKAIHDYAYGYSSNGSLRKQFENYWSHSKSDQSRYPSEIYTLATDPDLTDKQAGELTVLMRDIHEGIERNNQIQKVSRRPDIGYVAEQMRAEIKFLAEENKTLKEIS